MTKPLVRKLYVNKKNKQLSVSIPKKEFKKIDPTIKFGEDLFVEIKLLGGKK